MTRSGRTSLALSHAYRTSRQYGKYLGLVLTIVALGFVGWSFYRSDLLTSRIWLDPHLWQVTILATLCYTSLLVPIGLSWLLLINSTSQTTVGPRDGVSLYATTALYKYIPGNVLHYVGRHASLRQRGVEHTTAVWGALAETGLMLTAALLVAAVSGFAALQAMLQVTPKDVAAYGPILVLLGALAGIALFVSLKFFRSTLDRFMRIDVFVACLLALTVYGAFFALTGTILWWVSTSITEAHNVALPTFIAIWAAAWSIGFVTPGASAGIGIREALLIGALTAAGLPEGATLISVVFRLVTTAGDLLFGGLGWILRRLNQRQR